MGAFETGIVIVPDDEDEAEVAVEGDGLSHIAGRKGNLIEAHGSAIPYGRWAAS